MWFEGAQSFTSGTFHERNTTLQKTLEVNGKHPGKRAFSRCGGLRRSLLPRSSLIYLFCGSRSWFLGLGIWGRDLFCFRSACLFLPYSDEKASMLGPAPSPAGATIDIRASQERSSSTFNGKSRLATKNVIYTF